MRAPIHFFLAVLLTACGDTDVPMVLPHDHRVVMEVVLHHCGLLNSSEKPLFLRDADVINWPRSCIDDWEREPGLRRGLVEAFLSANEPNTYDQEWLGMHGAGLIDEAAFEAHFVGEAAEDRDSETAWESVLRGPPECTAVVTISAPGFSDDGSQALVYATRSRGSLFGNGGLYLLEFEAGAWVVARALWSWVS